MRWSAASFLIVFVVAVVFSGPASAETCQDRAVSCMQNGGTRDACYGPALASCKRTCTYVGPYTGRNFSATGDCGAAAKGKKKT